MRADVLQPAMPWPLYAPAQSHLIKLWLGLIGKESIAFGAYPNEIKDLGWWLHRSVRASLF